MAAHILSQQSKQVLTQAIQQMMGFASGGKSFWGANAHIPASRREALKRQLLGPLVDHSLSWNTWLPDWPVDIPIYSPYRPNNAGYSQSIQRFPPTSPSTS